MTTAEKKELTQEKLEKIKSLKKTLEEKVPKPTEALEFYNKDIKKAVSNINQEKQAKSLTDKASIKNNPKIQIELKVLQKASAYKDIVERELKKINSGIMELEGQERLVTQDIVIHDSMSEKDVDKLIADLDEVITKVAPTTRKLVITDEETNLESLDTIYDKYIQTDGTKSSSQQKEDTQEPTAETAQVMQVEKAPAKFLKSLDFTGNIVSWSKDNKILTVIRDNYVFLINAKDYTDYSLFVDEEISDFIWLKGHSEFALLTGKSFYYYELTNFEYKCTKTKALYELHNVDRQSSEFTGLFFYKHSTDSYVGFYGQHNYNHRENSTRFFFACFQDRVFSITSQTLQERAKPYDINQHMSKLYLQDKKTIIEKSKDKVTKIFNFCHETNESLYYTFCPGSIEVSYLSVNNKYLIASEEASGGKPMLSIWDVASGKKLHWISFPKINIVTWWPGDKIAIIQARGKRYKLDAKTGKYELIPSHEEYFFIDKVDPTIAYGYDSKSEKLSVINLLNNTVVTTIYFRSHLFQKSSNSVTISSDKKTLSISTHRYGNTQNRVLIYELPPF